MRKVTIVIEILECFASTVTGVTEGWDRLAHSARDEMCQLAVPYGTYRIAFRLRSQDPLTSGANDQGSFASSVSLLPNPSRGEVRLGFRMDQPGLANVQVFDAAGRMVRRLGGSGLPDGSASIVWDGHDARGQRTGAGIYFARIVTPTGAALVKITRR